MTPTQKYLYIITTSNKEGDFFVLNGKKNFVIDGSISDYLLVTANNESGSNVLICVVDSKSTGVEYNNKVHMDSRTYSDITFNNVKIKTKTIAINLFFHQILLS